MRFDCFCRIRSLTGNHMCSERVLLAAAVHFLTTANDSFGATAGRQREQRLWKVPLIKRIPLTKTQ